MTEVSVVSILRFAFFPIVIKFPVIPIIKLGVSFRRVYANSTVVTLPMVVFSTFATLTLSTFLASLWSGSSGNSPVVLSNEVSLSPRFRYSHR